MKTLNFFLLTFVFCALVSTASAHADIVDYDGNQRYMYSTEEVDTVYLSLCDVELTVVPVEHGQLVVWGDYDFQWSHASKTVHIGSPCGKESTIAFLDPSSIYQFMIKSSPSAGNPTIQRVGIEVPKNVHVVIRKQDGTIVPVANTPIEPVL
jgi:hypothetical protein